MSSALLHKPSVYLMLVQHYLYAMTAFPAPAPETKTAEDSALRLKSQPEAESQVIVHCTYFPLAAGDRIRIWKSTFLLPKNSSHRSKLVHVENISLFPAWTEIEGTKAFRFTLIFSGLPKDCDMFDLVETIPEPGGFEVRGILRNQLDIYRVEVS